MTKIKRLDRSAVQDNLTIIFLCLVLFMQMFVYSSWVKSDLLHKIYVIGLMSESVMIFIALFGKRVRGVEVKLLVLYLFWLLLTRFMNSDTTLVKSADHLRTVTFSVSLLCCGMALDSDNRRKALNIVSILVCTFFTILSVAAIYSAVIRTELNLPFGISFGFVNEGKSHIYQCMIGRSRNQTSIWFGMSFCLVLYQMLRCKKKIYIFPLAIDALLLYTVVGLSMSRGTMIALCVALALFFMLLADKKLMNGKIGKRILVLALIAVVSLPVFYKGYGLMAGAIDSAHSMIQSRQEAPVGEIVDGGEYAAEAVEAVEVAEADNDTAAEASVSESSLSDPRGKDSIMILGGRTYNWKSAIAAIRVEPSRLIKGGIIYEYMLLPDSLNEQEVRSEHFVNMHNFLVDALMLSGVLGLALMLGFTVLCVIRMVKVFFAGNIDIAVKALTIPLAAGFVKNMMETIIFNADEISNSLFCLIMGIFLAYSYELLPEAAKKSDAVSVE